MSPRDAIVERVQRVFAERLGIALPDQDVDLFRDGVLDSLSFVNLLLHLENEFGVTIPLEDLELDRFRSVQTIAQLLEDHGTGSGARGSRGGPT